LTSAPLDGVAGQQARADHHDGFEVFVQDVIAR
jgi:hypothetical protein